jgi:acylphosphatase
MTHDRKTVRARITGRVQGVSFRFWTRSEAERLQLDGWVRNEDDGSVSALISGPEPAVSAMLALLWKGPHGASVSNVAVQKAESCVAPPGFRITG